MILVYSESALWATESYFDFTIAEKMRENIPELLFPTRDDFRAWLNENANSSDGVWLIFGKTEAVITLSANDAFEEALCFGWIDGQIRSVGNTRYYKYFGKGSTFSAFLSKV